LELQVLADMERVLIVILPDQGMPIKVVSRFPHVAQPIFLTYNGGNHYNAVLPTEPSHTSLEETHEEPMERRRKMFKEKGTLVSIPYYRGLSERIRGIARSYGLELVFRGAAKLRSMVARKAPPNFEHRTKCVVYGIPCQCGMIYVGQTGRPLWSTRIKEHQANIRMGRLEGNLLAQHVWDYGHTVDFKRTIILTREVNLTRRKFKEALIIKALGERCIAKPSATVSISMDLEKEEPDIFRRLHNLTYPKNAGPCIDVVHP
jgi:predicted GIY-YIG superfamily endonuclease